MNDRLPTPFVIALTIITGVLWLGIVLHPIDTRFASEITILKWVVIPPLFGYFVAILYRRFPVHRK